MFLFIPNIVTNSFSPLKYILKLLKYQIIDSNWRSLELLSFHVGHCKKTSIFRSSGTSGSAPDLTSEFRPGPGGGASPVTEVWTNPAHENEDNAVVNR